MIIFFYYILFLYFEIRDDWSPNASQNVTKSQVPEVGTIAEESESQADCEPAGEVTCEDSDDSDIQFNSPPAKHFRTDVREESLSSIAEHERRAGSAWSNPVSGMIFRNIMKKAYFLRGINKASKKSSFYYNKTYFNKACQKSLFYYNTTYFRS